MTPDKRIETRDVLTCNGCDDYKRYWDELEELPKSCPHCGASDFDIDREKVDRHEDMPDHEAGRRERERDPEKNRSMLNYIEGVEYEKAGKKR